MLYPIQANLLAQRSLSVSPQSVSQSVSLSGWQIYLLTYFLLSSLSVCLLFLLHLICSSFYLRPSILLSLLYDILSVCPSVHQSLLFCSSVCPSVHPSLQFCSSVCPSIHHLSFSARQSVHQSCPHLLACLLFISDLSRAQLCALLACLSCSSDME